MKSKTRPAPNGDAITQLKNSASSGKLVAVVGTGVSMALTDGKIPALSWKGLVENGFAYGVAKGIITGQQSKLWKNQLNSSDLDDLLGAGRKLGAPKGDLYARWLESVKNVEPSNSEMAKVVRALHASGVPFCTLKYDQLLERVTGLTSTNFKETPKVTSWMRRESQDILHLHGAWDAPSTWILGIRDYETTLDDEVRDLIQRALGSFSRPLFLGCGDTFADPNFSALIKWLREKMKTAAPQRHALVSADQVAAHNADPTWHGFVEPIRYGADRRRFPAFLLKHFPATVKKKAGPAKVPAAVVGHTQVLQDYRTFLLKDCGQMTIEGVRAAMDTAQRKFDFERLFVPLKVLPTPPEFPRPTRNARKNFFSGGKKTKCRCLSVKCSRSTGA